MSIIAVIQKMLLFSGWQPQCSGVLFTTPVYLIKFNNIITVLEEVFVHHNQGVICVVSVQNIYLQECES